MFLLSLWHILESVERMLSSYPHLLCTTLTHRERERPNHTYAHPVFYQSILWCCDVVRSLAFSWFVDSWRYFSTEFGAKLWFCGGKNNTRIRQIPRISSNLIITPKQLIWKWLRCADWQKGVRIKISLRYKWCKTYARLSEIIDRPAIVRLSRWNRRIF